MELMVVVRMTSGRRRKQGDACHRRSASLPFTHNGKVLLSPIVSPIRKEVKRRRRTTTTANQCAFVRKSPIWQNNNLTATGADYLFESNQIDSNKRTINHQITLIEFVLFMSISSSSNKCVCVCRHKNLSCRCWRQRR